MSGDFVYGLHQGMPSADYFKLDAVSKSDLDLIAKSPLHWKQSVRDETAAMRIGSAVHCAVLEPERFAKVYVTAPECEKRTKAGKEAFAEFEAANAGKIILSIDESSLCRSVTNSINRHTRAFHLLDGAAQAEVSALWSDQEFNVRCRARIDAISKDGWLVDLKTTGDASPRAFAKSCANFRYHVQAAWYLDGYHAATRDLPAGFVFIAVEKTPPYAVAIYELDAKAVEYGRMLARRDLARYVTAKELDLWAGYSEEITPLSLPSWAFSETEWE